MYSVGVDIISIDRVAKALTRFGPRFEHRVYTPGEIKYCRGRISEMAARFAAKEAVSKALGTGVKGLAWRDIEVLPDRRGKPLVYLQGRAEARAKELGLTSFAISLSHTGELAIAFVVAARA